MTQSFRNLVAWQKSKDLVREVYVLTKSFPKDGLYGLTSQIRRAAISIPSNVAEGKGRSADRDFKHFLMQARGSLYELENQLEIAHDLEYVRPAQLQILLRQCNELGRLLNALINSLG
ncbi:MAG TPA: four helix bundle protein [Terriglobales bacterium]|nr:four helix bundle protein [Terriglobales bacterium]